MLDLFAGPGGFSEGILPLGLADLGLEWDQAACDTREAAGHATIQCDVAAHPTRPPRGRRVAGLIASPPCQAWSRAGKRLGLADQPLVHQAVADLADGRDTRAQLLAGCKDERSLLAAEPMRYLYDLRPAWVAMEEVPPVLPLWEQYAAILTTWGYSVWTGILNAADYGVPQTRRRAFLIASRERDVTFPAATHIDPRKHTEGCGRLPWVSMAQALGWGPTERTSPTICAGGPNSGGPEPYPSGSRRALERARDEGAWLLRHGQRSNAALRCQYEPAATLLARHDYDWEPCPCTPSEDTGRRPEDWTLRHNTSANACRRRGDQPAGTLHFGDRLNTVTWVHERPSTTVCGDPRLSPPGHRDRSPGGESQFAGKDSIRITAEEAAVLQSFRVDYPFSGTKTRKFQQIGNAVPPRLATHVVAAATGLPVPEHLSTAPTEHGAARICLNSPRRSTTHRHCLRSQQPLRKHHGD
ncbi:DNA cytosine methyltransferase [Streptomyces xiamenensis]|uniref:DNA cytosine methyltransferase n=1 Tax=Streptomyces xiamenensis TaxID=408015 RepID=UPI0035E1033A